MFKKIKKFKRCVNFLFNDYVSLSRFVDVASLAKKALNNKNIKPIVGKCEIKKKNDL